MEPHVGQPSNEKMELSETAAARPSSLSNRFRKLAGQLTDRSFRHAYVASHTKQFLARQIRAFRGDLSQSEFGRVIGQPQSVISQRLENPNYGKWTLQTLFDIAQKLDKAVVVRFVDFPAFLEITNDFSENAINPPSFDSAGLDNQSDKYGDSSATLAALVESLNNPKQETISASAAEVPLVNDAANTELAPHAAMAYAA